MSEATELSATEAEERAEHLKERIYVTFTALAVVLALQSHVEDATAGRVAATLAVTVLGTLLAVFTADFVSHLVVHAELPTQRELRHMFRVSIGAFNAVLLPLVFIGLAAADVWPLSSALRASTIALLVTLGAIGYLAVRRARMSIGKKIVVLIAEVVLGALVVGLELLVH